MTRIKIFYLTVCAFGFGLATNMQVSYLSTLLQFVGCKAYLIPYIWLIAPLTGLIAQPLLGLYTDNFHSRFGQIKPLFLLSTLLGTISFIFFPFATNIYAMILLIILFDLSINGNALLSRALILNKVRNKNQTEAFSWSTALAGLGAMFAGFLPWILFNLFYFSAPKQGSGELPPYIQSAFLIGAGIYTITSLITFFMINEKTTSLNPTTPKKSFFSLLIKSFSGALKSLPSHFLKISKVLFFAWVAVFAVWNYFNLHIAQVSLKMPISITDNLNLSGSYLAKATVLTSMYFGIIQISSTLFSLLIPILNRYLSIYSIFALGLGIGGISLLGVTLLTNHFLIALVIFFYGISWAVIATCPYIIFGKMKIKNHPTFFLGILNIMIVFPQIMTSLTIGLIYKYLFIKNATYIIALAGISLLLSMLICLNINAKQKTFKNKKLYLKQLGPLKNLPHSAQES